MHVLANKVTHQGNYILVAIFSNYELGTFEIWCWAFKARDQFFQPPLTPIDCFLWTHCIEPVSFYQEIRLSLLGS